MDSDMRVIAKAEGELSCQGRIELDAVQASAPGGKKIRNGAMSRADLNNGARGCISKGCSDAERCRFIDQEVLTKLWLFGVEVRHEPSGGGGVKLECFS